MEKIIAIDIGSSGIKTCIFQLDTEIKLLHSCLKNIGLYSPKTGYEQHDPDEVWDALCESFFDIFKNSGISPSEINLVSICSQAQCVVLVDKEGNAITPIYNSQDSRALDSYKKYFSHGIKISGFNIFKTIKCYVSTGFMPAGAKDPVFKYKWIEDNHPEIYKNAYKWLDIKDYIALRLTGSFATTKDDAHTFAVYNSKENKGNWSKPVCKMFRIDMDKLPKVIDSTDIVGHISKESAAKTGLNEGTAVIGGIIDSTGVQYGSGAAKLGEVMVYWGTSGWVGTVIDKIKIDIFNKLGGVITAEDGKYHYYAGLESAGISYKWIMEHIIGDDGILGEWVESYESDSVKQKIYEIMDNTLSKIPPGSEGLIYAPWITGCRAPMEASDIGGMFVNIKYHMGKKHFVRAAVEGICYHYRLLLEASAKYTGRKDTVRFVGGGANSDDISQILADITGCTVEVPPDPQDAGAYGAAIVGFHALEKDNINLEEMAHKLKAAKIYTPNPENHELYNKIYKIYKMLYNKNKKILSGLTAINESR